MLALAGFVLTFTLVVIGTTTVNATVRHVNPRTADIVGEVDVSRKVSPLPLHYPTLRRVQRSTKFCAGRRDPISGRGKPCCRGRNDRCSVAFYGTVCYCDEFCYRTKDSDCCPDYSSYCYWIKTTSSPATSTSVRPHLTSNKPTIALSTSKPLSTSNKYVTTATTTIPSSTTTEQSDSETVCFYDGVGYQVGEVTNRNCNKCVCILVANNYYRFICEENICLIRPNIIEAINQGKYGWTASNYSFFWGLTQSEGYLHRLGTSKTPNAVKEMSVMHEGHDTYKLPDAFDSRDKWPGSILPPRDQMNCGSSWAFSSTSVASDRIAIQSKGLFQVNLSPQHLISCSSSNGCSADRLDRAWWFLRKMGAVTLECYPHTSGITAISGACLLHSHGETPLNCPSGLASAHMRRFKTSPVYRISSKPEEIMREILRNGPVQVTMKVQPDFFLYESGIYFATPVENDIDLDLEERSYHSVKLIGWGTEGSSSGHRTSYWIAQNSWGETWGEEGYFRIRKGNDESEIERTVLAVWAKLDTFHPV